MKDLTVFVWECGEPMWREGSDEKLGGEGWVKPNDKWSYLLYFMFILYFRDCWGDGGLWKIKLGQDMIRFAFYNLLS